MENPKPIRPYRKKLELKSEINITPFVDVLLILLLVFMVTAPNLENGFDVSVPSANNSKPLSQEEVNINISVSKDGLYYINDKKTTLSSLGNGLQSFNSNNAKIFVKADENVKYNLVIDLINELTILGFNNISLVAISK